MDSSQIHAFEKLQGKRLTCRGELHWHKKEAREGKASIGSSSCSAEVSTIKVEMLISESSCGIDVKV